MDSASFPHPLISRVITSSSLHRSYATHHSARFGLLWKNRAWNSNSAFCVVGFSAVGIEDVFDDSNLKRNGNGSLLGALNESSSAPFGTFDAEITPETSDFFVSDAEGDPDCPSKGYSSIEQALNALRQGKFVVVVDDENGDIVEGNLVKVASLTSDKDVAFMIKHGSGIISVGMKEEELQRLKLPLMSPETEDEDSSAPTFTITVILRDIGVRTMRLMTNNPAKFVGLKGYGLAVVGRVPVMTPITEENKRYLETKRIKMGHVYGSDIPGFNDSIVNNNEDSPENT